jgi:hypothetical protein
MAIANAALNTSRTTPLYDARSKVRGVAFLLIAPPQKTRQRILRMLALHDDVLFVGDSHFLGKSGKSRVDLSTSRR